MAARFRAWDNHLLMRQTAKMEMARHGGLLPQLQATALHSRLNAQMYPNSDQCDMTAFFADNELRKTEDLIRSYKHQLKDTSARLDQLRPQLQQDWLVILDSACSGIILLPLLQIIVEYVQETNIE